MANLQGMNINPNAPANNGGMDLIPPGLYEAVIIADKLQETANRTGQMLVIEFQITKGDHAGKRVIDRLNVINANPTAQIIGQGQLRTICELHNVQFPPADTSVLYGRPMQIQVINEPYTDNNGNKKDSSKVNKYFPAGTQPQHAQPAQPPNQTPPPVNNSGW